MSERKVKGRPNWAALVVVALLVLLAVICAVTRSEPRSRTTRSTSPPVSTTKAIKYEIIGERVNAVSLTWENNTGGTEQGDYKVPFRKTYAMSAGDFVYISAQIIQPTSNAGWIECRIYVNEEEVYYARASGFASIATCSGSAR